ncbi:MFS transporter [Actinophytocola xinjiangensis]|uniref:MFS transporter n=1 Tax=Actinophytocola xinjiangensis TaxID=485602 RepID=A0A7Z0WL08_9PSEU|nr:MFS transporter [Actinophytocola xinjiangensis]OLF09438.1 MFS transporter [Actinophytocola xinjiangensis]
MRRWLILAVGIVAQATTSSFLYGMPFLIPELQSSTGASLAEAGVLVSAPLLGLLTALIAWGAAADRFGERVVLTVGLAATGVLLLVSLTLPGPVALGGGLLVAGAAGASVNAASGRVVLGWFGPGERGLAMGLRQTSQPLGVGLAAATLPGLAERFGYVAALALPATLCLLAAALVVAVVKDPPRPPRPAVSASPYRAATGRTLTRLHVASALLVAPQFMAGTFAVTFLVSQRSWSAVDAGRLVAVVSVAGAVGRILAGVWSDRVGNRLGPMRIIALLATATMLAWAAGDLLDSSLAVAALVAALVVTVTDNGLGFTATAELAGPFWAGRALGVQNTGQNAVAMAAAPLFGGLITAFGYPWALAATAVFPLAGAFLTPVAGERRLSNGVDPAEVEVRP